jgi:hypothetical protein
MHPLVRPEFYRFEIAHSEPGEIPNRRLPSFLPHKIVNPATPLRRDFNLHGCSRLF